MRANEAPAGARRSPSATAIARAPYPAFLPLPPTPFHSGSRGGSAPGPRRREARAGRAGAARYSPGTAQVQPRCSPVTPPHPYQEVPPQPRQRLPRQPLASGRRRSSARAGRAVRREAGPGAPSLHRDGGRFPADASRSPGTCATGAGGPGRNWGTPEGRSRRGEGATVPSVWRVPSGGRRTAQLQAASVAFPCVGPRKNAEFLISTAV